MLHFKEFEVAAYLKNVLFFLSIINIFFIILK